MKGRPGQTGRVRVLVAGGPRRQAGFTLTELVVSIGILAMLMTMVGTVFKVTTESTGDARAVIEINQALRLLEQTLRQDLAAVNPGRSMLVIQANPVNAYWRAEHGGLDDDGDPSTGYPHDRDRERETIAVDGADRPIPELPRADVLMFFASRSQRSYMYPDIWSNVAQVMYGHAELGKLDKSGAWAVEPEEFPDPAFPLPGDFFPVSAEQWHLARRCVLLIDALEDTLDQYDPLNWDNDVDDIPNTLDDTGLQTDGSEILSEHQFLLKDGVIDLIDLRGEFPYDPGFDYEEQVVSRKSLWQPRPPIGSDMFRRSRLDLRPPPQVAERLGHYFLPRCASFKVEWALDLGEFPSMTFHQDPHEPTSAPNDVIWLDPGRVDHTGVSDPLGELYDLADRPEYSGAIGAEIRNFRDLELRPRFAQANISLGPQTPVWYATDEVNPGGSPGDPDRYFPVALRVTVDVYDEASRLDRPIRHVMVLPVGSQ